MINFAQKLKELRLEKRLTQKELAQKIGVHNSAISFWELGENEPKASYLVALSKYFEISIEELLGLEVNFEDSYGSNLTPITYKSEIENLYSQLSDKDKERVMTIIKNSLPREKQETKINLPIQRRK